MAKTIKTLQLTIFGDGQRWATICIERGDEMRHRRTYENVTPASTARIYRLRQIDSQAIAKTMTVSYWFIDRRHAPLI